MGHAACSWASAYPFECCFPARPSQTGRSLDEFWGLLSQISSCAETDAKVPLNPHMKSQAYKGPSVAVGFEVSAIAVRWDTSASFFAPCTSDPREAGDCSKLPLAPTTVVGKEARGAVDATDVGALSASSILVRLANISSKWRPVGEMTRVLQTFSSKISPSLCETILNIMISSYNRAQHAYLEVCPPVVEFHTVVSETAMPCVSIDVK